jgi:hypothetical protein
VLTDLRLVTGFVVGGELAALVLDDHHPTVGQLGHEVRVEGRRLRVSPVQQLLSAEP